ncbi:hypothetical protein HK100_002694 [Physocladia obscura]|uniref:Uncharacterized protein n=1 Tax=Physocladia obscura TaxID=109957 RepID=A0AAD5SXT3_9FUNG|nr:hypothetical protein HK100_002694 [Physocladia obscura]
MPESSAGIDGTWGRWSYAWLNPLLKTGRAKTLIHSDLWKLDERYTCEYLGSQLDIAWKEIVQAEKTAKKPSSPGIMLLKASWKAFGAAYSWAAFYMWLYSSFQLVSAVVLMYLIEWVQNINSHPYSYGYGLAVVLFFIQLFGTISYNKHLELTTKTGFAMRTSLVGAIYRKAFKISMEAKKEYTVGKITNLTATDTNRIDNACQWNHYIWSAPYSMITAFALLIWIMGPSALAGMAVVVVYIPFQFQIIKVLSGFRRNANIRMDKRVKMIQEVLLGIRVVKIYGWEEPFKKIISSIRSEELQHIRGFLFSRAIVNGITQVVPTIAMLVSFIVYTVIGNQLESNVVFAALQLFYTIRNPMTFLPNIITGGVDAFFGLGRIGQFLLAPEMEDEAIRLPASDDPNLLSIEIKNATFEWLAPIDDSNGGNTNKKPEFIVADDKKKDSSEIGEVVELLGDERRTFKLTNVNLNIPRGKLVAIVGKVGSGKSSLLNALVGEMPRRDGSVTFRGSVGFCQQQAWIQNTTVRENILFGQDFDEKKYNEVVKTCSLSRDFAILPNNDETEIGERGINLSGGQKQRVSIARAVYYDPDIVLLDDPLSAVDAHVGRALFEECILGKLAGKTRVLVTHQLHFLPRVDMILMMDGGNIAARGTYEELLANNSNFATLMQDFGGAHDEEEQENSLEPQESGNAVDNLPQNGNSVNEKLDKPHIEDSTKQEDLNPKVEKGIMIVEERNEGAVSLHFYLSYLKLCGGVLMGMAIFVVIFFAQSSRVMTDEWLTYWTNRSFNLTEAQYIGIYIALAICSAIGNVTFGITMSNAGVTGSWNMHGYALSGVMRSPLSFFDATPLGRITSRFSRDFDGIDNQLPLLLYQFCNTFSQALANFILISINIPEFLAPLVFLIFVYYRMQVYYRSTARELKRLDSISRSPLLANVGESINGLPTIRAYNATNRFLLKNSSLMDNNNRAYFPSLLVQRWIQLRVEGLNALLVFVTTVLVVALNSTLSPEISGLVLVYVSQSTAALTAMVRQSSDAEINMNSAERIIHYIDELPRETEDITPSQEVAAKLVASWPQEGAIEVKSIMLRYRADLPPVLHKVSFSVEPGSNVGIVGRTGAGKSTILTAILRLFEIDSGSILIDGVDVSKIGLTQLRHKLGVIPQEPVLFSGTIRSNLDPFSQYSDQELWSALERADLKTSVAAAPGGLDSIVMENGENWSTGQRQLICLSRAILKNAKVIMLDEATASVDLATDDFIQKAIRTHFANSTVLTIAHRLNTIADYDKILVLGAGKVLEYDSPANLLADDNSHFAQMVAETGPANTAVIKELANKSKVK